MRIAQYNNQHQRSFSFSDWESADKCQTKFYYNYRSRQNQHRGDMPTFGQGSDRRVKQYFSRNSNQQPRFEAQNKALRQYKSKQNYSLDNWNRAPNFLDRPQTNQYYVKKPSIQSNALRSNHNYTKTNIPNRTQFDRATEQKLSNIQKINQKIKRILNTLNQQQKKINQHHIKVGNKKLSSNSFAQRIKTQGNDYGNQNMSYYEGGRNLYNKLQGIRERYNCCEENVLKDANLNKINNTYLQRSRKGEYVQPSQNSYYNKYLNKQHNKQYRAQKSNNGSPFNMLKQTVQLKQQKQSYHPKPKYQRRQTHQDKQNIKYDAEPSTLKFLKGANAKSTDSLNLSMSICVKKQNDSYNEEKNTSKQYKLYRNNNLTRKNQNVVEAKKEASLFNTRPYQYTQSKQRNTKTNHRQEIVNSRKKSELKSQKFIEEDRPKVIENKYQNFENMKIKQFDRTPTRCKNDWNKSRLQASQKSCKLQSGKDLDAEIQRIQRKIQNCDSIKKELNIEDDEAGKKSRISLNKSLNKYKQNRASASRYKYQAKNYENDNLTEKSDHKSIRVTQFNSDKINIAAKLAKMGPAIENNAESQINDVEVCLPKPFKMAERKGSKRTVNNSAVKEIESTLISEERVQIGQQSLKILIDRLCKQIQYDTKFRNSKKWFNRKVNPSKWQQLSKQLSLHHIGTNDEQNRQIFTMKQIQDNPFHTDRDEDQSYKVLIQNFLNSEKFWIDNIQHKFIHQEIEKNIMEMDIERKGNIKIQDMVRYINLQSDQYYRNRDLCLIFRRLSGTRGQVTVDYILSEFCRA